MSLLVDTATKFGDFLDAPVTGSKPAAEGGTLVFMVGGDADITNKVSDILLAMGRKSSLWDQAEAELQRSWLTIR